MNKNKRIVVLLALCLFCFTGLSAQEIPVLRHWKALEGRLPAYALKSNLLYGALAQAPNLGIEYGLTQKTTVVLSGGANQWNRKGDWEDNRKLMHWYLRGEYRYWFCERYNGGFLGGHLFGGGYNISDYKIPLLFKRGYRYDGYALGAGITYGYNLTLGKRWGLEFAVGLGAAMLHYDRFPDCICTEKLETKTRFYVGPTRADISLVFLIR